jgi:general secretion pathway protein G
LAAALAASAAISTGAAAQIWRPIAPVPSETRPDAKTPKVLDPYMRVDETPGRSVGLQIASRTFAPSRPGLPTVTLVGVAHIGDRSFYESVQELLAEHTVVLYESVKPPGAGTPGGDDDAERARTTKATLEFVAMLLEAHRATRGSYPPDLDTLERFVSDHDARLGHFLAEARHDAWGGALVYAPAVSGGAFSLRSLGADGRPGGEGADLDLEAETPDADSAPKLASEDNLQAELAATLGLDFQLDAIDYGAAGFRPADMAMDELERAFAAEGVDFAPIEGSLAGTSLPAKFAKFVMRAVRYLDLVLGGAIADTMKVVLIEVLSDEAVLEQSLAQFGEGFGRVIIDQRNQVAVDRLKAVIEADPQVDSVAMLYGAAHMEDMGERLVEQLGYRPDSETWLTAFDVDIANSAMTAADLEQVRRMVRRQLRLMR